LRETSSSRSQHDKEAADYQDHLDRSNPAMPLPPDFADISNIGRSRDKAVCRSGEEKGS
jgi:hypothetical protein